MKLIDIFKPTKMWWVFMHFWGATTYFCIYTNFSEKYTSNPGTDHFLNVHLSNILVCVDSIGQRSSSPQDSPHDKIALPDKLHVHAIFVKLHGFLPKLHEHAIYRVLQSYCVGCCSTRLDLRNVVFWNEHKLKIFERCMLRKWSVCM